MRVKFSYNDFRIDEILEPKTAFYNGLFVFPIDYVVVKRPI